MEVLSLSSPHVHSGALRNRKKEKKSGFSLDCYSPGQAVERPDGREDSSP